MRLVEKYRYGNISSVPASNVEIDSLATLESIKRRQGWLIAAQVATVSAITKQTEETTDALNLVNETLVDIENIIQSGFDSLESCIDRLEANLVENLNEIKWYLFNVDNKLDQLINLVKFSGATKSAEFNRQGFVLYKIGSYEDAINQFNRSLEENPLNIEAYINLGFVYLRQEKLSESIESFEKANKIVKEDFSYFKEISDDQVISTQVFIWQNLANLYGLKGKYHLSIELSNKILGSDIDKNTNVLSRYNLSKYLCLSGANEGAIKTLGSLINDQYLEPVALAVSNPDFQDIKEQILSLIQVKLEDLKVSLSAASRAELEKLDNAMIDEEDVLSLKEIIEKLDVLLRNNKDYKRLLSPDFKEKYKEFLDSIELFAKIRHLSQEQLATLELTREKIMRIVDLNETIDDNYSNERDIPRLSHKILLTRVKSIVQSELQSWQQQFDRVRDLNLELVKNVNKEVESFQNKLDEEIIRFILENSLTSTINQFKSNFEKVKGKSNLKLVNQVINSYNNLFELYLVKDSVLSHPSQ